MNRYRSLLVLLCAVGGASACEKDAVQDLAGVTPSAAVKFFNFGVGAPGVNFFANDTKITAINSATGTESTLGTNYGQPAAGGFYAAVQPGQYTLSGRIAAATDKGLAIASTPAAISAGKYYSYYLSGIYNASTKTADAFIVEDPFVAERDFSVAYVRFVHAISNANPMTLYAKSTTTGNEVAVGTTVAYKGAGAFVALPGGVYDLGARYAGSTANAVSGAGVSFSAGTVYTVTAIGDITVTSTTAANRPQLNNTANR